MADKASAGECASVKGQNLVPFLFQGEKLIRVVEKDQPWFVASDIACVLEFRDAEHATRGLDDDEKGTLIVGTPGGEQRVLAVNESGLYTMIMRSRKPAARAFRKWITAEVIPSIRKTGSYGAASAPFDADDFKAAIGGIMKGIIAKHGREMLVPVVAEMMREMIVTAPDILQKAFPVRAIVNFVTVEQALVAGGADRSDKRAMRSLRKRFGDGLRTYCLKAGMRSDRLPNGDKTWIFDPEAVRAYKRREGSAMIREHNASVRNGQPALVLSFKRPAKA